jgi:hypothetical protein
MFPSIVTKGYLKNKTDVCQKQDDWGLVQPKDQSTRREFRSEGEKNDFASAKALPRVVP